MNTAKIPLKTAVCQSFGIQEDLLFAKVRWTELVNARACYAYMVHEIAEGGLSETKRHMGYKAHETVNNAIRKCENHYHKETEFRARMDRVLDLYNNDLIDMPAIAKQES